MDKRAHIANQLASLLQRNGDSETMFSASVVAVDGLTCTIDYDGLELSDVSAIAYDLGRGGSHTLNARYR